MIATQTGYDGKRIRVAGEVFDATPALEAAYKNRKKGRELWFEPYTAPKAAEPEGEKKQEGEGGNALV